MTVPDRVRAVENAVTAACDRADRARATVTLVAVSKTHPPASVIAAARAGITDFGENRVQEASEKVPEVTAAVPGLRWHLVGHLQTNKAKRAVELFTVIHSLDSARLAEELEARAEAAGKAVKVLIEVNTSGEESKFGVQPGKLPALALAVMGFDHLALTGLMTIGPGWAVTDPEASRPCFAHLRRLRDNAQDRLGRPLPDLSMGMSSDFAVGIDEGATIIRVGTALFGARE